MIKRGKNNEISIEAVLFTSQHFCLLSRIILTLKTKERRRNRVNHMEEYVEMSTKTTNIRILNNDEVIRHVSN